MAARARASAGRTNRQKTGRPVYGSGYVHGTAAPKLEPKTAPSPERPGKKPADRRSVRASHRIRRNQERAMYMDLPYVIMLTIASVFTLCLCINYLHVQSSITARMHNIERSPPAGPAAPGAPSTPTAFLPASVSALSLLIQTMQP